MESIGIVLLFLGIMVIGVPIWLILRVGRMQDQVQNVTQRLEDLETEVFRLRRGQTAAPAAPPVAKPVPPPEPEAPPVFTPVNQPAVEPAVVRPVPPPLPVMPKVFVPPPVIVPEFKMAPVELPPDEPAPVAAETSESTPPPPAAEKGSFEMRLGTFWLVRAGIVMLLTGLVFFGNFAYHNYIGKLGPAGKVSLLYLASAALLGAGAWWQRRKAVESLKNYAQVLFAGGLAAVYFTTYAAYHIPPLRIITSPVMDGALLLGWAGFMAWIADRRKSEVLAFFAVGLAYYTSIITHVGAFTLYSNLVLTLAAVVFLVRNRWTGLSFGSLIATYAGYVFWRFFHDGNWHWATPEEGLWFGTCFLAGYWLVFTAAVFLSKAETFAGQPRAGFLTLNNGAFFTLFLLTMLQVHSGGFWKFSLGYGALLLALAGLAKRLLPDEPPAKNAYLTQGLVLVTVGFVAKFSGLKLSLVLGAESVILFVLGLSRRSLVLQIFSYASGALAVAWACASLDHFDAPGLWLGVGLGTLMAFNSFWSNRQGGETGPGPFRPATAFFALLAAALWLVTTWFNASDEHFPLVLAAEAVALTLSIYWLRVRELSLLGQGFLLIAQCAWLLHFLDSSARPPWWNPLLLIGATLGLSHWWQHQKTLVVDGKAGFACQSLYALAVVGVIFAWLHPLFGASQWLAMVSLLAVAATAYGVFTRAWPLAVCGQIFLAMGVWEFVTQLWNTKPEWYFPLAPLAALGGLSLATMRWFARDPGSDAAVRGPLLNIARAYRWIALVMSLGWINQYVPDREHVWGFMAAATAVFAFAGWRRSREAMLAAAPYALMSLATLWCAHGWEMETYLPNLLALLALLGCQQAARRLPDRYAMADTVHSAIVIIACVSLWRYLSCWMATRTGGFYLTASWAALSLVIFGAGIGLRERIYRWVGLGILAVALGRVVLFDVWKQETIYRVLTFMALGVALLVLGFVYNRYQEKIREWL